MGRNGHRLAGRRRASCAAGLLRPWASLRDAVSLFAALLILTNAAVPYWHAAQKAQAWASAFANPAMADGVECPLHNSGTGGQKGGGEAPLTKKPCPLCQALQLFSPGVTQPGFAFLPCGPLAVAAFIPHRVELKSSRETAEQGRPRAPPLA